jgi:hypothetical protein
MPKYWTGTVKVTATWEVEIRPEDEFEDEAEFESALQQGRFEDEINYESQHAPWDDYEFELLSTYCEDESGNEWDEDEDEDE